MIGKKSIIFVILFISNLVNASENLFKALDVESSPLPAPRTVMAFGKQVGGLYCSFRNHIINGDSYSCTRREDREWDPKAIWNALKSDEVLIFSNQFSKTYEKAVDNLVCVKTLVIEESENIEYNCNLVNEED